MAMSEQPSLLQCGAQCKTFDLKVRKWNILNREAVWNVTKSTMLEHTLQKAFCNKMVEFNKNRKNVWSYLNKSERTSWTLCFTDDKLIRTVAFGGFVIIIDWLSFASKMLPIEGREACKRQGGLQKSSGFLCVRLWVCVCVCVCGRLRRALIRSTAESGCISARGSLELVPRKSDREYGASLNRWRKIQFILFKCFVCSLLILISLTLSV